MFHNLKVVVVAASMVASALAAKQLTPVIKIADLRPKESLDVVFPRAFDGWRIDDASAIVLPAADVQARLDKIYNQVLTRAYIGRDGYRIMLSVAYGGDQSDGLSVHRPEVCYPAQGFEVDRISDSAVKILGSDIPVTRLVTHNASRNEPVTYWVVNGDVAVGKRFDARLIQFEYSLKGLIPDGMLVRISSIDKNPTRAFEMHDKFAASLAAAMQVKQRIRIGVH